MDATKILACDFSRQNYFGVSSLWLEGLVMSIRHQVGGWGSMRRINLVSLAKEA